MTPTTNQHALPADPDRLMTLQEVGRLLQVSKWTVYQLINDGRLATVHIGRRRLVAGSDYAELVSSLRRTRLHG